MANTKISALTALTGADLANNDQFAVVDTSAVATKSITVAELKLGIMPAPGPVGATTPSTGAFTTLSATGAATLTAVSDTTTSTLVLSNSTSNTIEAYASTASADQKRWGWQSGSAVGDGVYRLRALNDARTSGISALTFQRTGIASVTAAFGGSVSTTTGMAVGGATPGTGGLAFPATAVAVADANTLDDYEEGSFTPAANVVTYSAATGRYTKIGNVVTIIFSITFPATADTADAQITNLPFTVSTGSSVALSGYTTDVNGQATNGSTILRFIKADGSAYKTNASLSTQVLFGTLVYRV